MRKFSVVLLVIFAAAALWSQQTLNPQEESPAPKAQQEGNKVTLPPGTKIPLVLRQPISTKVARTGDAVYAQTNFPITLNDRMVIPPGTYVQGTISSIKRAGRIKGRAEVLFHFTTMIFPSGYTITLPGAVENVPGYEKGQVRDQEGTIQQGGEKGKDVATVATTGATGAAIGAGVGGLKGAGIGGAAGGAAGLAIAMLTRGSDVRLEQGSSVDMVLARPLVLDMTKVGGHFRRVEE